MVPWFSPGAALGLLPRDKSASEASLEALVGPGAALPPGGGSPKGPGLWVQDPGFSRVGEVLSLPCQGEGMWPPTAGMRGWGSYTYHVPFPNFSSDGYPKPVLTRVQLDLTVEMIRYDRIFKRSNNSAVKDVEREVHSHC